MSPEIAAQIQAEQCHGRQKYGTGPNDYRHDDSHHPESWHDLIADHNVRAQLATPSERRQYLIKLAGLAVSAVESYDRKQEALR